MKPVLSGLHSVARQNLKSVWLHRSNGFRAKGMPEKPGKGPPAFMEIQSIDIQQITIRRLRNYFTKKCASFCSSE
jgi:hypothetical protein